MLRKLDLIFVFVILGLFISQLDSLAARGPKFRHADRNKDGVVDKREFRMEKQWEQKQERLKKTGADLNGDGVISPREKRLKWRHEHCNVNTPLEKKYDENGDGWLQPQETKEFLKDRYTLIKTNGKAAVDSPIEKEYDTNEDGIIDAQEAEALKEDLQ